MTTVTAPDPLLLESADNVLVKAADGDPATWPAHVWQQAMAIGLTGLSLPEAVGGSGGTVVDAAGVLQVAGRHGCGLPLTEAMLTAGWVLSLADRLDLREPVTIALPWRSTLTLEGDRLSGNADRIAWAREAATIVCLVPSPTGDLTPVAVDRSDATISSHLDIAQSPRDSMTVASAPVIRLGVSSPVTEIELRRRTRLAAAALVSGGLQGLSAMTSSYAAGRQQFGQPINRFQSVQQLLVTIEQQAVLADMAVRQAAQAMAWSDDHDLSPTAAAVIAAGAAARAVRAAHQVHGAIGLTREYPLHRIVRAIHAWRAEDLNGHEDARELGLASRRGDAEMLYPLQPQIAERR